MGRTGAVTLLHRPIRLFLVALCVTPFFASAPLRAGDDEYPGNAFVKPRLALEQSALVPGKTSHMAVVFDISKGWHLYWRNAGDSGMPPQVSFKLPQEVTVGEPQWPAPARHVEGGMLVDYIFEQQLVLIYPVSVSPQAATAKKLSITAELEWLVCSDKCVPGKMSVKSEFDVSPSAGPSRDAELFARTRARHPERWAGRSSAFVATWRERELVIDAPGATHLALYPFESDDNVYPEEMVTAGAAKGGRLRLTYPESATTARTIGGVVAVTRGGKETFHELRLTPAPR
ncbi:MAG: hypothetical protein DCC65_17045 [Planctomycetota bacterium]|nr:MAG: hypothetical protein DCC65_17045 [Planctomycetota bacterium]